MDVEIKKNRHGICRIFCVCKCSNARDICGRSYSWEFDPVINKTFSFILAMDWRELALTFLLVST